MSGPSSGPTTATGKPLPTPSVLAKPFWEGLRIGELRLQRCQSCGHYNHPPKIICPKCHDRKLEWKAVSPKGAVYSYTVVYRPPTPAFKQDVPYAVGLVDIGNTGVRLLASLEAPIDQIRVGMEVDVIFDAVTEDFSLFRFRPAAPEEK